MAKRPVHRARHHRDRRRTAHRAARRHQQRLDRPLAPRPRRFELTGIQILGDDEDGLVAALDAALDDADLVLTTGGLGPTDDDRNVL